MKKFRSVKKQFVVVPVTLMASLLGACRHTAGHSGLKEEIPGSYSDTAFLGQAYDATKKKLYNVACVQGTEKAGVGNSSSELTISSNMDYSTLVRKLDGNLSATVSFPAVSAGASAKLALESQYDDRSETHNIIWIGVNRKKVFVPNSLKLSEQGKKFSGAFSQVLQNKCGDEFVNEIQYGASLFATLKVEYLNSSDKFEIGGSINVSAKEILKVDANAQFVNNKIAKRTKVTVIAKQFGGNPAGLLTVIPKGIVTCSFDNMQPCIEAFNNIVDYAVNHLAPELTGAKPDLLVQDSSGNTVDSLLQPQAPDSHTESRTTKLPGGDITESISSSSGSSSSSSTSSTPSEVTSDATASTSQLTLTDSSSSSTWNVLKYNTARYDESGFEVLTPTGGWSKVDAVTKRRRADLQDRFIVETDMFNRASFLINSASGYIPGDQLLAIKDIKKKTEGNINVLVDAQVECLNEPKTCADRAETTLAGLAPVDKWRLDIEVGQKRSIGNFNFYNIVGGYSYGGKYDDTKVGGPTPRVTGLRFTTSSQETAPNEAAAMASAVSYLRGVELTYDNGKKVAHGNLGLTQVQTLDLSGDTITQIKTFFGSASTEATPRVTGLSIATKSGKTLTVGTTAETFSTVVIPDTEVFVGFIGSSGADVDSIGVITRSL